jgi:TonB family protein
LKLSMKNLRWQGILGTLGFHGLVLCLIWGMISRAPFPIQEKGLIEIQIYSQSKASKPQQEEASSEEFLPPAPSLSGSNDNQVSDNIQSSMDTILDDRLLLPPKEAPYLPAAEADVRPQPESAIVVPYPDQALGRQKGAVILVLYINEAGGVDHIEIDKSDLPTVFEEAATKAFAKARMQPAIKEGKKIRSRMKILVEFETK